MVPQDEDLSIGLLECVRTWQLASPERSESSGIWLWTSHIMAYAIFIGHTDQS